jgi:hypothetical protein
MSVGTAGKARFPAAHCHWLTANRIARRTVSLDRVRGRSGGIDGTARTTAERCALNLASRIKNAYLARTKSSASFRIANCLIFLNKRGFNAG